MVTVQDPQSEELDGAAGIYYPSTGSISIGPGKVSAVPHEVFHAVQEAISTNAWEPCWITEGTAVAAQVAFSANSLQERRDARFAGRWRNWIAPLNNCNGFLPYQTAELFLEREEGYLAYLRTMLDGLADHGYVDEFNSYSVLQSLFDLESDFVALLMLRNGQDYPYSGISLVCNPGTTCVGEPLVIDAMSAIPYEITILDPPEGISCPDGYEPVRDISRQLRFDSQTGDSSKYTMLVGKGIGAPAIASGVAVNVGAVTDVWLVNHDSNSTDIEVFGFVAEVEVSETCQECTGDACPPSGSVCGDGLCAGDETCTSCNEDCPCTACNQLEGYDLWVRGAPQCRDYTCRCPDGTNCHWRATVHDACCDNGLNPELYIEGAGCWRNYGVSIPLYEGYDDVCQDQLSSGFTNGFYWCNLNCGGEVKWWYTYSSTCEI